MVIIPTTAAHESSAETRLKLQHQIAKFGFPVRFLTPDETLAIAGILPQQGPPRLVWELAGNACSPFLFFEALNLIASPEARLNFRVPDLRRAWSRKLNLPMLVQTNGSFPGHINTTVFVRMGTATQIVRTHETIPLPGILAAAACLSEVDKELYTLCSPEGTVLLPSNDELGAFTG